MSISDRNPQQAGGPNLVNIEFMRNHSELFRAECSRLIMESNKACKRMQNNDNKQLGKRGRNKVDSFVLSLQWSDVGKNVSPSAVQISGSETSSF